jgi:hypothetical protein
MASPLVPKSMSDSNLSSMTSSQASQPRIPKKKREVNLETMTPEEIEDASVPPTKEWVAELEDKMELCQVHQCPATTLAI